MKSFTARALKPFGFAQGMSFDKFAHVMQGMMQELLTGRIRLV